MHESLWVCNLKEKMVTLLLSQHAFGRSVLTRPVSQLYGIWILLNDAQSRTDLVESGCRVR